MSNQRLSAASGASPISSKRGLRPIFTLLTRLHFYIGLFVGPFIFVAALSGLLYVLTPQLEDRLYVEQLFTINEGPAQPLARQVEAARLHMGAGTPIAIRPAPVPGTTTRVIFSVPDLAPSSNKAVFVDPVTAQVRGDLMVYGTSGVLPLRTWLDHFHRSLLLGEWGRLYSELAASWLWIAALSGLVLWSWRRRESARTSRPAATHRVRRWHAALGLWLLVGLLFISVTGLTWSEWAGRRIGAARAALGMMTPKLATQLDVPVTPGAGEHDHHAGMKMPVPAAMDSAQIDEVLHAARGAGIDAAKIEIRPAIKPGLAWTVTEIDRGWPTQVDAVAIDPYTLNVIDKLEFEHFPLAAKLTRWGVDAHMGVLFGVPNQLFMAAAAGGLLTLVIWGYLMWWRRLSRQTARTNDVSLQAFRQLSRPVQVGVVAAAITLGYCLPVLGASLVLFILFELASQVKRARRLGRATAEQ